MSNNILELPVDILLNILNRLHLSDLRNVILTCKTFRNFVLNDSTIWRSICRNRLILDKKSHNGQKHELTWYNRCRISNNWCNGTYRCKVIVQFHSNYMPWLTLHRSEILMLSKGSELLCYPIDRRVLPTSRSLCWSLSVPIVNRDDVRTNDISRFVIRNNSLVCGNRDGSTAIYKVQDFKCRPQLIHHIRNCHENGQVEVTAVELIETRDYCYIVTGSNKSPNALFWQLNKDVAIIQESVTNVPIVNGEGVKSMAVNHNMDKLAIGVDGNSKPLLFDVNIGKHLMNCEATRNSKHAIRDIGWHNENTLMFVTHSGMLHLMDLRTHHFVFNVKDPFLSTLYCIKSDSNNAVVVGSSEYSRCVLFDVRNCRKHMQIYFTQKRPSPVYCLDFDSTRLITAVDRGISAMNFNVNTSTVQARDYSHVFKS